MQKLKQTDYLPLVPFIIFCLMTFMFTGINWAKADRLKQEIEFCPVIETYLYSELVNNEIIEDEGLNKTNKENFIDSENKHYEDLDVVEITKDIAIEVKEDHSAQTDNMVEAFKPAEELSMKGWVLNELFKNGINTKEAECVIQMESSWNSKTYNVNINGTKDIGLWQISNKWHNEVSDKCAYDFKCSTKEAIRIYKERGNWSAWYASKKCNL